MKNQNDKQRLFEVMEKINPDFNNQLNENINIPRAIEKVKTGFNIENWDSPEGFEMRKQIAKDIGTIFTKLMETLRSTVSDEKRAETVKSILTGSMYFSAIMTIWNALHPDFQKILGLNIRPDFSDAWSWAKFAAFLFILRLIHSLLVKGRNFKENIKNVWDGISNMFTKINENEWVLN